MGAKMTQIKKNHIIASCEADFEYLMLFCLHLPKTDQEVSHHTFISPLTDSLHYSIGMTDCSLLQGINSVKGEYRITIDLNIELTEDEIFP